MKRLTMRLRVHQEIMKVVLCCDIPQQSAGRTHRIKSKKRDALLSRQFPRLDGKNYWVTYFLFL